jgi:hypothetical protein
VLGLDGSGWRTAEPCRCDPPHADIGSNKASTTLRLKA